MSNKNNDSNYQGWHNLPTKLEVPKISRIDQNLADDKIKAYGEATTSILRNLKRLVGYSFKHSNNMSQDPRSFKYLKELAKDRKIVICCADKNGKLLVLHFKEYCLIMERKFANQFQKLRHVDLTRVHNKLQHLEDKSDNFLKNLHRGGTIDDIVLFHVTGLKKTRT